MTNFITSEFLKTALAFALLLSMGGAGFAQPGTLHSISGKGKAAYGLTFRSRTGSNARVSAVISRPGNSQDFSKQAGGTWLQESNSIYTYDAGGRLTQRLYQDPITAANLSRDVIVYDAQGNETENRSEQWVNNAWEIGDGYKTMRTYNTQGRATEAIFHSWNTNMVQWDISDREQTTYDANNQITSITYSSWQNNTWEPMDRIVFSNPNGVASGVLVQVYDGGTWTDDSRANNVTWHVLYDTPASYTMEIYDNSTWMNDEKYSSVYDANGGHVGLYQSWNSMTNTWVNSFRETETIDVNQNFNGWRNEAWNPSNNTWNNMSEEQEVLSYTGMDVTQRIFRDSYNLTNTLTDTRKEVYSNFQTFAVSGLKNLLPEAAVTVFPNPATDLLHITFPQNNGTAFKATLTDITGKTCLAPAIKNTETNQVDISTLPKGVYLLKLQSDKGTAVKRIVKQ
jgi:hypothetical protein